MEVKVAIIVPFRDLYKEENRSVQLEGFLLYMKQYMEDVVGVEDSHIFIIEQSHDGRKFNRGKLLNAGYAMAKEAGYNVFIFHDVDLLPQRELSVYYKTFPTYPIHIAASWDRYNQSPKYIGGILSMSSEIFEAVGGFPNTYWGWGGEDDELAERLKHANITVIRVNKDIEMGVVDVEDLTLVQKLNVLRHGNKKCMVKWELNAEHNKLRSVEEKPSWWGYPASFEVASVKTSDNGYSTKATLNLKLNYDDSGKGHWSNSSAQI